MDGGDVMEVDVYKKMGEHWKGDREKRKEIRRKNIKRRE